MKRALFALLVLAPAVAALKVVKVGLVGGGTVGGGIVEILKRKDAFVKQSLGVELQVAKVVVGNVNKERDWVPPAGCEIISDPNAVIDDPDIDIVVEVMGGTTLAKEVITKAIKAGKHVVTANKALIAAELPGLQQLLASANEATPGSVQFGYEAAVCGGIPIIHALQRDFLGDDIVQLSGIINGCTNYILSSMSLSGASYADALADASKLGYAEADPTLDVGGFDARSKLKIMMKLAFGIDVCSPPPPSTPRPCLHPSAQSTSHLSLSLSLSLVCVCVCVCVCAHPGGGGRDPLPRDHRCFVNRL